MSWFSAGLRSVGVGSSDNRAYTPVPWPDGTVVLGQVMWTGRTL